MDDKEVVGGEEDEERRERERSEGLGLEREGYYHGSLTWWHSEQLLRGRQPGTFLLRDSQVGRSRIKSRSRSRSRK